MDMKTVLEALKELKTKLSGLDHIAQIDVAEVEDFRGAAKDAKELKERIEKFEASIEKLPEEWREDVKKLMATLPHTTSQPETKAGIWQKLQEITPEELAKHGAAPMGGEGWRKSFLSPAERDEIAQKAIEAQEGTAGALTSSARLWNKAITGDPWVLAGAFQMPLSSPNFLTVEAKNISFKGETEVDATKFDATVGDLDDASHMAKTYVCRVQVPNNQESDLPGTIAHIERMIQRAYGKQRGALTTAVVRDGVLAGNKVPTGSAAGAITEDNAIAKLMAMTVAGNLPDYHADMPAFVLNSLDALTAYLALLDKGGLAINPETKLQMMAGYDINIDTQADANKGAGKKPDFFGAWEQALVQAQLGRLIVDRYDQTIPGAIAIYAAFRFRPVVVNNDAYSFITVAAN